MKIPDTNFVPESIRKAMNSERLAMLEAVIAAALEAAARGDIETADAVAVIMVGIEKAKIAGLNKDANDA
jgi:hypothetical protein